MLCLAANLMRDTVGELQNYDGRSRVACHDVFTQGPKGLFRRCEAFSPNPPSPVKTGSTVPKYIGTYLGSSLNPCCLTDPYLKKDWSSWAFEPHFHTCR